MSTSNIIHNDDGTVTYEYSLLLARCCEIRAMFKRPGHNTYAFRSHGQTTRIIKVTLKARKTILVKSMAGEWFEPLNNDIWTA